ncbi:MAG TPA: hypothetical protein VM186_12360 [Planctomycetota bacterium]|nr:hypothetical protein [Planctomycetota bacterium]
MHRRKIRSLVVDVLFGQPAGCNQDVARQVILLLGGGAFRFRKSTLTRIEQENVQMNNWLRICMVITAVADAPASTEACAVYATSASTVTLTNTTIKDINPTNSKRIVFNEEGTALTVAKCTLNARRAMLNDERMNAKRRAMNRRGEPCVRPWIINHWFI